MNLKFLILTFLVVFSLTSFSQLSENDLIVNFSKLGWANDSWKEKSNDKSNANDTILLKSLLKDSRNSMHYCFEDNNFSDYKDDFYFIDLDGDLIDEIVYSGRICGGFESKSTAVFKKIKEKYVQVLITGGRVLVITEHDFIVNEYPCCDDRWHTFSNYEFNKKKAVLKNAVTFFASDDLYDSTKTISYKESKVISAKDSIFYYDVNYKDEFYEDFIDLGFYYFGKLKKEKEIEVYEKLVDQYNTTWFYCKFQLEDIKTEDFHKKRKGIVFAWVKFD